MSGVVTEQDLIDRSRRLETSLQTQNVAEFCHLKLNETSDEADKQAWDFISANLHQDPRKKFLDLLGYDPDVVADQV